MIVCSNCAKEMKCVKTGRSCVWHNSHVYAGDEFECPECGAKVVKCGDNPYHLTDALEKLKKEKPIDMRSK